MTEKYFIIAGYGRGRYIKKIPEKKVDYYKNKGKEIYSSREQAKEDL